MITKELIAKAICQYGSCKECTEDCVDYRAAMRVAAELEANGVEVSKDGNQV
jgi:hypothetical protein